MLLKYQYILEVIDELVLSVMIEFLRMFYYL